MHRFCAAIFLLMFSIGVASTAIAADLLLYGGERHEIFVGCLNCSKFGSDSICNKFGKGGKYADESIFNKFGDFGSRFSDSSPWNKYSSSEGVPVLVDRRGNFYGYFTINRYRHDAFENAASLAEVYEVANGDLEVVRNLLCR